MISKQTLWGLLASTTAELERIDPRSAVAALARAYLSGEDLPVVIEGSESALFCAPVKVGRPATVDEARDATIVRLYEGGKSALDVAAYVNTSPATVYKVLRRSGVQIRPRGQPPREPDPERIERIRAMRAEGKTLEEIGAAEHLTRERVRQLCKRVGIDTHTRAPTPREQAGIDAYLAGDSILTAAEIAGVQHSTMRNLLLKNGHEIRPKGFPSRKRTAKTLADAERAAQLYAEGKSNASIAREIGIAGPTVYRLLAIAGVKPNRRPSGVSA